MFTGAFSNSNGPSGWDSDDIELNLYMVFTGVPLQGKVGGWLPTTRCRSDGHPRSFLQSQQVTLPCLCTHFIISCYSHYWGWFSHLRDSNTHASWEWRMLGYWRLTGRCFNTDFGAERHILSAQHSPRDNYQPLDSSFASFTLPVLPFYHFACFTLFFLSLFFFSASLLDACNYCVSSLLVHHLAPHRWYSQTFTVHCTKLLSEFIAGACRFPYLPL